MVVECLSWPLPWWQAFQASGRAALEFGGGRVLPGGFALLLP